jgi:hypothetical protein
MLGRMSCMHEFSYPCMGLLPTFLVNLASTLKDHFENVSFVSICQMTQLES